MEVSQIVNAHTFEKEKKHTQGYMVFGLPVSGGMLSIFPNTDAKKRFSDRSTLISQC